MLESALWGFPEHGNWPVLFKDKTWGRASLAL